MNLNQKLVIDVSPIGKWNFIKWVCLINSVIKFILDTNKFVSRIKGIFRKLSD